MIGRFFMQHPRGVIGKLETSPATALALQDRYNIFQVTHGLQYEVGLALSEAAQREHGLLNASAILTYEADPDSGWEATKRLIGASEDGGRRTGDIGRLLRDPMSAARNLWRRGVQKRHAGFPVTAINVLIDLEQRPDPESRITLTDERDRLGMRKASVDWRLAEQERHTAAVFADILRRFFGETGVGRMRSEPWLQETGPIGDELAGTYHHIATLRMSTGPESGVVDADCMVHGTDNLFVAGCAVFPTGGHANPTFTIIALALRLADRLRSRLSGKPGYPTARSVDTRSDSLPA
jgi:choline dehydrogenase-like flavoprotein